MCGRGRHGRPWPCEWDVGREPDRDERSEPPAATPPPVTLNVIEKMGCKKNRKRQSSYFPCRDGATPSIITRYHTNVYKTQCGFLAKKSPQIHAKMKWHLIINVLQDHPWHRPRLSDHQYATPETLTTALPSGYKKRESLAHRTATTSYPCCLPTLGEFRGSWSCTTFPTANIRIFL